ncbi:MAG: DMT family transporter [Calditrichaeota bacterium]|nr:MAG: DMT family transporter [Calditrichota bacterium]
MNQDHSILKPLLALAAGALCISFAPVFVKMIDGTTLGPTAIAFWRTLFGAGILFIWALVMGKKLMLPKSILLYALIGGFIFFCDLFVWHKSIIFSGAGIATILGNTQVFWMALIGVTLFDEKLKPIYFVSVLMAFVGVVLLVGFGSFETFETTYINGIIFGLMTGVFYAGYLTTLKKSGHAGSSISFITMMAWVSLFSAIFLGIAMLFESDPILPDSTYTWVILFSLAFVAQSAGWYIISANLPKLRASQSGMVLLLQPTMAAVWGWLFFAENLTVLQIFGAVLTLAAIYFGSVKRAK